MKTKTKIFIIVLMLALTATIFVGCTDKNTNILKTGADNTFDYENLTLASADWTLETAETAQATDVFNIIDNALVVKTVSVGWAKAMQQINLQPNTYYLIEYNFTSTGFSSYSERGYDGLFVTIMENEDFNTGDNAVHHRGLATSKTTGKIYFKTTQAKKTTLAINVGTEDYPVNVTEVKIYDIKLIKVPKSQIVSEDASFFTFKTDTYSEASTKNIPYIVFGALAIAVLCYAFYVMFQRNMAIGGEFKSKFMTKLRDNKYLGLFSVIGIALFIRLFIDILVTALAGSKLHFMLGYNVEGLASQALFLGNYGTAYLSESLARFCTNNGYTYLAPQTSPLQLYLLTFVGLISRIFTNQYLAATFFIKFFASIADIGAVVLIYTMVKKHSDQVGATIISLLYALLPVTFALSSLWGFTESITVFLILLTFYFMLKNNYYGVVGSYFAAFLFSWTAIIVAPIIIFYTIQQAINNNKLIIPIIIATISAFVLFYLLDLPFSINQVKSGTFFATFINYWGMLFKNSLYTINTFNFQGLLGNNLGEVTTESLIVTIIFVVFLLALVAFAYFKFKNRMNLLLLATAFFNMFFVFGNDMTPWALYMSLTLMLVYAILNKEKRIYFAFSGFSVLMFVNMAVAELVTPYTANAMGIITTNATTYIFGALYLLLALFYVYVVYDIIVTKKVRRIQPMNLTYIQYWQNQFLRLKKFYYKLRIKVAK